MEGSDQPPGGRRREERKGGSIFDEDTYNCMDEGNSLGSMVHCNVYSVKLISTQTEITNE